MYARALHHFTIIRVGGESCTFVTDDGWLHLGKDDVAVLQAKNPICFMYTCIFLWTKNLIVKIQPAIENDLSVITTHIELIV